MEIIIAMIKALLWRSVSGGGEGGGGGDTRSRKNPRQSPEGLVSNWSLWTPHRTI